MNNEKKQELNKLSLSQWRELHGVNAPKYAYFDHSLNKWVTWTDLENKRKRRLSIDRKVKALLGGIKNE